LVEEKGHKRSLWKKGKGGRRFWHQSNYIEGSGALSPKKGKEGFLSVAREKGRKESTLCNSHEEGNVAEGKKEG